MKWLEGMERARNMAGEVDRDRLGRDSGYRRAIVRTLVRDESTIPRAMQNMMEALGLDIGRVWDRNAPILCAAMRICAHCSLYERCLDDPESHHHLCPNAVRFDKLLKMEAAAYSRDSRNNDSSSDCDDTRSLA